MVRIIAGEAKGRTVKTESGADLRPTLGRVKSALFSVIGDLVVGADALDLFAGSGNLGLEAVSRGAEQVTFVESNPRRCDLIRRNLENLGFSDRGRVVRNDALRFLDRHRSLGCGLIMADPPYSSGWIDRLIRRMAGNDIPKLFINAEPGAILIGKAREFARSLPNQEEITVKGSHFVQEDSPDEIGTAIRSWHEKLG